MTKLICIGNLFNYEFQNQRIAGTEYLTIGKIYEGEFLPDYFDGFKTCDCVRIKINDINERNVKYYATYFMPLAEWREQQISSILND
jgi:hypothetical protein